MKYFTKTRKKSEIVKMAFPLKNAAKIIKLYGTENGVQDTTKVPTLSIL